MINAYQVSTIEFAQLEQSVLYGLSQGSEVLKQIHEETRLERVEQILDTAAESQHYQNVREIVVTFTNDTQEINDMLSSTLTADEQQSVEEELVRIASQAQEMPDAGTHHTTMEPTLPSAPKHDMARTSSGRERTHEVLVTEHAS